MDFNKYNTDAAATQHLMQSLSWEDQQALIAAGIQDQHHHPQHQQSQQLPVSSSSTDRLYPQQPEGQTRNSQVEAWLRANQSPQQQQISSSQLPQLQSSAMHLASPPTLHGASPPTLHVPSSSQPMGTIPTGINALKRKSLSSTTREKTITGATREKSISPSASSANENVVESKRIQNRLAQREFRQRRQTYIATLEAQVAELTERQRLGENRDTQLKRMREHLDALEDENTRLRQALREIGRLVGDGVGGVMTNMSHDLRRDFAWKGKRVIKPSATPTNIPGTNESGGSGTGTGTGTSTRRESRNTTCAPPGKDHDNDDSDGKDDPPWPKTFTSKGKTPQGKSGSNNTTVIKSENNNPPRSTSGLYDMQFSFAPTSLLGLQAC